LVIIINHATRIQHGPQPATAGPYDANATDDADAAANGSPTVFWLSKQSVVAWDDASTLYAHSWTEHANDHATHGHAATYDGPVSDASSTRHGNGNDAINDATTAAIEAS